MADRDLSNRWSILEWHLDKLDDCFGKSLRKYDCSWGVSVKNRLFSKCSVYSELVATLDKIAVWYFQQLLFIFQWRCQNARRKNWNKNHWFIQTILNHSFLLRNLLGWAALAVGIDKRLTGEECTHTYTHPHTHVDTFPMSLSSFPSLVRLGLPHLPLASLTHPLYSK